MTLGEQFAIALQEAGKEIDAERFVECLNQGGTIFASTDIFPKIKIIADYYGIRCEKSSCIENDTIYAINLNFINESLLEF